MRSYLFRSGYFKSFNYFFTTSFMQNFEATHLNWTKNQDNIFSKPATIAKNCPVFHF